MQPRRLSDSEAVVSRPSRVNVPFSWEKRPGMSKVAAAVLDHRDHRLLTQHLNMECFTLKLMPPPRLLPPDSSARFVVVDRQSRLPLCLVQPSLRLNSFKLGAVKKEEDPFLAAFMKCTAKSPAAGNNDDKKYGGKKIKTRFSFSCKYSCAVNEDSIVRLPQSPKQRR